MSCCAASSARMRSAARLSSTSWKAVSTSWRYVATVASYVASASTTRARRRPASNRTSENHGPIDLDRLGDDIRDESIELSKPATALNDTVGKYAAFATPI